MNEDAPDAPRSPNPSEADRSGEDHDRIAESRDQRAATHDQESEARDVLASARDARAVTREQGADRQDGGAAADRAGALRDRRGSADDRDQAADDREAASGDRRRSARDRAHFAIDALTGAHRRDAGLVSLGREVERAKRTGQAFTLAFVDVDDLKGTNDRLGHAAGDRLLTTIVDAIRSHLRSYDLIVRFGGDEFLCALSETTAAEAVERFAEVGAGMAARKAPFSVGITALEAGDALEDLIERADRAMYRGRDQPSAEA